MADPAVVRWAVGAVALAALAVLAGYGGQSAEQSNREEPTAVATAGVGLLPLVRDGDRGRVNGTARHITRRWVRTDYRVRRSRGLSASMVAEILARRATAMIGTPVRARAIGPDEVSLAVAKPVRPAGLALATQPSAGRLAFYDWEADALTPDGRPVGNRLRRHPSISSPTRSPRHRCRRRSCRSTRRRSLAAGAEAPRRQPNHA
jgi:hypothetical protein